LRSDGAFLAAWHKNCPSLSWTSCLGGWTSLALAQASASPHALWQPPDLHSYTRALQPPEGSPLAPEKRYA